MVSFPEPSSWHSGAEPQALAFGFSDSKFCSHSSPRDSLVLTLSTSKMPTLRKTFKLVPTPVFSALGDSPSAAVPLWPFACSRPPAHFSSAKHLGPDFTQLNRTGLAHPVTVGECFQEGLRWGWNESPVLFKRTLIPSL